MSLLAAACGDSSDEGAQSAVSTDDELLLPAYSVGEEQGYPTAIMSGVLELRDGCVYLDNSGPDRLLVWFPGTRLVEDDQAPRVVGPDGRIYGEIGQNVALPGGDAPASAEMVRDTEFDCEAPQLTIVSPLD